MEVHTSNVFSYNGEVYESKITDGTPNNISCFILNQKKAGKKINRRLFDINTNDYKNLTTNKMIEIVNYYNKFEEYAFNISKKIKRNYLKKV